MSASFGNLGATATGAESITPARPTSGTSQLLVAFVFSGHPTVGTIPTCDLNDWQLIRSFEGGGGVYGVDAGPRRISFFIHLDGVDPSGDPDPTFTIPAGTDSVITGYLARINFASDQPVTRYQSSMGEDTSSGTGFSAACLPEIVWSSAEGQAVLLAYALATDSASATTEAITAAGITYSAITERSDTGITTGADMRRVLASGTVTAGGPAAVAPAVAATLAVASTGVAGALRIEDKSVGTGPASIVAAYNSVISVITLTIRDLDEHTTRIFLERSTDQIIWTPVRSAYDVAVQNIPVVSDTFGVNSVDSWSNADTGQVYTLTGGIAADYDKAGGLGTMALTDTNPRAATLNTVALKDSDSRVEATFAATALTASYMARLLGRYVDASNYYFLEASADTTGTVDIQLVKRVATVETTLISIANSFAYAPGDVIGMRLLITGARLRAKVWNETTGSEPAAWMLETRDLSFTTGATGLLADRISTNTNVGLIMSWNNYAVDALGLNVSDWEFTPCVTNYYRVRGRDDGWVLLDSESTTVSATPFTSIWIKSPIHPFLNIEIQPNCRMGAEDIEYLVSPTPVSRPSRNGVFPIINRTFPVAVTDLRLGREWNIRLRTWTTAALKSVDFLLASGDVLLIQVPDNCVGCSDTIENGYVVAFDAEYQRHRRYRRRAIWDIPVQEVAPPGPDIVYANGTWQTVIDQYGSWTAVLAAFSSWQALLAILPQPSEVIVP